MTFEQSQGDRPTASHSPVRDSEPSSMDEMNREPTRSPSEAPSKWVVRGKRIFRGIDEFNARIGKTSAWMILFMTLMYFFITVLRYGFREGSVALQESVIYMHSIGFLLTAAYALRARYHVRVDIFYEKQSPRRKAMIDIFGTIILLFPVCFLWLFISFWYVFDSWKYLERSIEAGGLGGVFLLKTLIIIAPFMLILQGISDVIRGTLFLKGHIDEKEWH